MPDTGRMREVTDGVFELTHWHDDHTGGLAELRRRSGATVVAHAIDAPVITGADAPEPTRFQRFAGLFLKAAERAPVDDVLTEDGPIDLPGFRAFHTPGHTAGHVSFLLDRGGGYSQRPSRIRSRPGSSLTSRHACTERGRTRK